MRCKPLLLIALVPMLATRASAQRLWLPADTTRNIGFEVGKGFFKSTSYQPHIDAASFTVTVQGRVPVNAKVAVTAALPFARISQSFTDVNFSPVPGDQTAFGNPWLGVEVAAEPELVLEAGFRPGIASRDKDAALGLGVYDDFDRFEAWVPDFSSARAMAHIGRVPDQGAFVTGIFGGTVFFPGSNVGGNPKIYANYGVRGGFSSGGVLGSVTFTGRYYISGTGGTFADRSIHQLGFSLERARGAFRPNASVRVFLKEAIRSEVSPVVTLGASFVL